MSDKLSFGIEIEGAAKSVADLKEIERLQKAITAKGGMADLLRSSSPQGIARSPDLVASLRQLSNANRLSIPPDWYASQGALFAKRMGSLMYNGPTPPVIPGFNWKQALMSAAIAPVSPWVAARGFSGAFGKGGGGGAGGAGGMLFGAGGFSAFAGALVAVTAVTKAVTIAFESLKNAVAEGSKLYQDAAKTAHTTAQMAQLKFVGAATGISEDELKTLLVRRQHPLRQGSPTLREGTLGEVFASGKGIAQVATLQQIKNMSEDISKAWNRTALAALEFGNTAKALQGVHANLSYLSSEWKTAWAQVATILSPAVNTILMDIELIFKVINFQLSTLVRGLQLLGIVPKGDPGNAKIGGGSAGRSPVSGWERMGFNIGGFGQSDYAKQTAQNTKVIAKEISKIAERAQPHRMTWNSMGAINYNMP